MNITPTVTNWSADGDAFSLIFDENPLADFVELPFDGKAQEELWYSNILCGVLRGALEMVCIPNHVVLARICIRKSRGHSADIWQIQVQIEARFVSDVLRGHDNTEMRVSLIRYIEDEMPPDED